MKILVRGGGDLASGAIVRMARAGWQVLVTELSQPMAVRRSVSFAQAVYDGSIQVEDVTGSLAAGLANAEKILAARQVAVLVDPQAEALAGFDPAVIVDARMRKLAPNPAYRLDDLLVIGLGPGFVAGENCHAVIETNRGPFLGRVIWHGPAQADTGVPERVGDFVGERVLRSPVAGILAGRRAIGEMVRHGDVVATVAGEAVRAPFDGILRGLLQDGLTVTVGIKIGDVDPRGDPRLCSLVSDKALAVGGGVVEAVLTWLDRRKR